jgi:outer membrane protein OmpA-like peptidoglycan-associated protein
MIGIALTVGRSSDARAAFGDVEDEEDAAGDLDAASALAVEDRCPDGAEDDDGFEDADGCPDPDNDRDGIADADDRCPLEPEVVNGVDDADGCPDQGLVAVVDDTIVLSERIFFETSKARIRGRSEPILEAVAALLRARTDFTRVRIEGHADDRGNARYNQRLSERRAERVVQKLVSLGVDPSRLEFVGYGRTHLAQHGYSPSARQANRRVEFRILETADGTPPRQAMEHPPTTVATAGGTP